MSNRKGQGSLVAVILASVIGTIIIGSTTQWFLSMNKTMDKTSDQLESMTIATSEWQRLEHMSLDELEANRENYKTPYKVGDNFTVGVNLGEQGFFDNGTCNALTGDYASESPNCFKDTTMTVYDKDGKAIYTTRSLPLFSQNGSNLRDVEFTIPVDEKISHDEEHRALITHFTMPKFLGSGMNTPPATYTVTMPNDGYIEVDNISATNDLTGMTCRGTKPCAFFPSIDYDKEYHLAGEQLTLTNHSRSIQFMGHGVGGAGNESLPVGVEGDVYVVPRIVKSAHNLHVKVPVDEMINLLAEQHKEAIIKKYDE